MPTTRRRMTVIVAATIGLTLIAGVAWIQVAMMPPANPSATQVPADPGPQLSELLQPWEQRAEESKSAISELLAENSVKNLDDIQFPAGEAVHTRREQSQRYFDWAASELRAFEEREQTSPEAAQSAGKALLKTVLECECDLASVDHSTRASRLAQAALDAGVQDAYVRYQAVRELDYDSPEAELKAAREAGKKVLAGNASLFARLMVRGGLRHLARLHGSPDEAECLEDLLSVIVEWIEQSAEDASQQRFILRWLSTHWGDDADGLSSLQANRLRIMKRCLQAKRANPWLMHMLIGLHHYAAGWTSRGTGFADTVSETGQESFQNELRSAGHHFVRSYRLRPDFPESASMLISVALAGDQETLGTPAHWFQRAIRAEFDYRPAYERMLWTLEPRWGGSHEAMLRFGDLCLQTERFDTYTPQWAINVLDQIQFLELGARESVLAWPKGAELFDRFQRGLWQAVEERERNSEAPPVVANEPRLLSFIGVFCLKKGDFANARRVLRDISPHDEQLKGTFSRLQESRELGLTALAAAADDEPFAKSLLDNLRAGFPEDMLDDEYRSLLDDLAARRQQTKDPLAQRFFAHAQVIAQRSQVFHRGDWVPLSFEDNAAGWEITADDSKILDDATVQLSRRSDKYDFAAADSLNHFPLPFVVDATIEQTDPGPHLSRVGIFLGARGQMALEGFSHSSRQFTVDREPLVAGIFAHADLGFNQVVQIRPIPAHRLRVKAWPQWFAYSIDGYQGFNERDENFEPPGRIGFGSAKIPPRTPLGRQRGNLKVSNIRIRKRTVQPPPADVTDDTDVQNLDEFERYYVRELEFDPDDSWTRFILGAVYYDRGKYAQVPKLMEAALADVPFLMLHGAAAIIGSSLEEQGRYDEVDRWYARQIQETPDELNTLWLLARFRSTCPDDKYRDGAKALALAERACQLNAKQRWEPHWSQATALAETGQFDQALAALDQALTLVPAKHRETLTSLRTQFAEKKPSRRKPVLPMNP